MKIVLLKEKVYHPNVKLVANIIDEKHTELSK